ncbi:MAG TPA: hypothetical protein VNZ03_07330 [Terriglobales bacterium]|nr:hypothetical protein [Terriglobales bacterium]
MRLTTEQQDEIKTTHDVCVNEACESCRKPLDYLRYTRKDEPGEWCSRECRDGVEAANRHGATRKHRETGRCWHCGLALPADARAGSKYCDATCERNARFAKHGGRPSQMAA